MEYVRMRRFVVVGLLTFRWKKKKKKSSVARARATFHVVAWPRGAFDVGRTYVL